MSRHSISAASRGQFGSLRGRRSRSKGAGGEEVQHEAAKTGTFCLAVQLFCFVVGKGDSAVVLPSFERGKGKFGSSGRAGLNLF